MYDQVIGQCVVACVADAITVVGDEGVNYELETFKPVCLFFLKVS